MEQQQIENVFGSLKKKKTKTIIQINAVNCGTYGLRRTREESPAGIVISPGCFQHNGQSAVANGDGLWTRSAIVGDGRRHDKMLLMGGNRLGFCTKVPPVSSFSTNMRNGC